MIDSCAACGCKITDNQTPDGLAVQHGTKLYCAECASMILPPDELERLTQRTVTDMLETPPPQPAVKPAARVVASKPKPVTRTSSAAPASRRAGSAAVPKVEAPPASARAKAAIRARKSSSDPTGLYIGLGIGALVLAVGGYFIFGSGKAAKTAEVKEKPKDEFVDNDKTPSDVYAQKGRELLQKKDRIHAIEMFRKAAGRAEKEGNTPLAQKYNMQIVSIEKESTLH